MRLSDGPRIRCRIYSTYIFDLSKLSPVRSLVGQTARCPYDSGRSYFLIGLCLADRCGRPDWHEKKTVKLLSGLRSLIKHETEMKQNERTNRGRCTEDDKSGDEGKTGYGLIRLQRSCFDIELSEGCLQKNDDCDYYEVIQELADLYVRVCWVYKKCRNNLPLIVIKMQK